MGRSSWQDIAHEVQNHRDSTIAQVEPSIPDVPSSLPPNVTEIPKLLLSQREVEITTMLPEDLVTSLAKGNLTCTEVTTSFLRRAGLAQKLTNCITELLPERALKRAKELDEYLREHQKPLGPLHGLPISVKEHIGMKGLDLNAGFVAWVGTKAVDDALVLKALWDAGCVFFVRTTEPQLLMHIETSSNLFGETVNPFNRSLTSGGSSGGEGSLIGLRGSCLGVGSDIGGSIRCPAAHNGLFGLRPTSLRISKVGSSAPHVGSGYIQGTLGPMSTSLNGIKMFMKTILDAKPWRIDPSLVPLSWHDEKSYIEGSGSKRLRVAVLWNDGVVQPHPPVVRALKEVVEKLRKVDSVEVVDWKPYRHDLAWEIIASLYYIDGGDESRNLLEASGEPWLPLSRFICSESPHVKPRSVAEIQDLNSQRNKYQYDHAQHWNSTATSATKGGNLEGIVDVILCPAFPGVAPPLGTSRYWSYTSQWNLLDYPAVVFPVTTVDPKVDGRDEEFVPMNEKDEYNHGLYDGPEVLVGVPVSLQLVARRYEDEKVIEALEYIIEKCSLPFT